MFSGVEEKGVAQSLAGPQIAASVSPGSLLEMQSQVRNPRPAESESQTGFRNVFEQALHVTVMNESIF